MELSNSYIKKFIFQETKTPKEFLILKSVLIFQEMETSKKLSIFSGNGTFIFQERYIQNSEIMELIYISGKVYSEH